MNTHDAAVKAIAFAAPGVVSMVGLSIPLAPAIIGVATALLVRAPVIKFRTADISITILAMLGAFVAVVDNNLGLGAAFWMGVGFGGTGTGLIQAGKSAMGTAIKDRAAKAFGVLFNVKGE